MLFVVIAESRLTNPVIIAWQKSVKKVIIVEDAGLRLTKGIRKTGL
jgi:hypothetical protein